MAGDKGVQYQNVIVMRHGERIDHFEPTWAATALRPWDPPLVDASMVRAFSTGRKIRNNAGFQIHRVFVSPFLRCAQTASQTISALCALHDDPDVSRAEDVAAIDTSKIKVAFEYGLSEMVNRQAISIPPKDENWDFNFSELETIFPAGTMDHTVHKVHEKMPPWEEKVLDTRARYAQIVPDLANKYPSQNLLLVTHGEGIGVVFAAFQEDKIVYAVEYCAYAQLRRTIAWNKDGSFTAGNFELVLGQCRNGISNIPATTDATH